ncbi:hypothetical protein Cgig2_016768 [Carnegiea gigantea]|uniref:Uncharacterized protein n=1 Tax=Carnegiea gigantea TaxID=171969 RepID=A0A9Q1GW48_9CARY|nr:hypothetical protein Cgig2_016768 [Carnegiea gigantea]
MAAGTGDPRRTITIGPFRPMPTLTIAQATDAPLAPTEEYPSGKAPLSTVQAVSAPGVPLAKGTFSSHEQNGHTTFECRELRKSLHELANKWQIDRFLKWGPRFLRKDHKPIRPEPRDKECSTEIVATVIGRGSPGLHGRLSCGGSADPYSGTRKSHHSPHHGVWRGTRPMLRVLT